MQNLHYSHKFQKYSARILLGATVALLAACGDGGTVPVTSAPANPTGVATAANIQLMVSSQQILTSSIASTDLTAVVLDATGQAVSDKVVTFSKGADSTAYFSDLSGITNSNGVATAKLNLGTDMTNRIIAVTATADGAVGTNSITATGTKIAISGNTSLALNAPTTLTIIVKDSSGTAVSGMTVAVVSQNGNPVVLSPASGITDVNGQITATVTATNAGTGTDVLTVTGAGASQTQTLTINSASFAFTAPTIIAPATTPEIVVNVPTNVSVTWTLAGAPVVGSTVNFYTSRGTITASAVTNASGVATASVIAPSTGATIITASANLGGTPAATLNAVFITTNATNIVAQANPGTVAVNSSTSTSNQSVISVVVRDATQNLVKNAEVVFTSLADPSGGSLAAGTAITDITGTASVNYIAGSSYSCQNCVQIQASVSKVNGVAITPISATALLTVASQSLYVRLATDNKIFPDTPVQGTHTKQYTALVTDAAGNPAPDGTEVRFVLRPPLAPTWAFEKGEYAWVAVDGSWQKTSAGTCVSEDADRNNILGTAEDINLNGALDPLGVATVNATATTTSGFAIAKVVYSSGYSTWVKMDLEGRAGTAGNDPPNVVTFELPGLAADYTTETPPPPGRISPFGQSALCTDTN